MRKTFLFLEAASLCSNSVTHAGSAARQLRARDVAIVVPTNNGASRITFCTSRHLLLQAIERHKLLEVTRMHTPFWQMLGTNLSFTNMLAGQLEGEERVATRFTTQEATIEVESLALGECRAYLSRCYNNELLSSGAAAFPLTVDRILYNQQKPFTSIVNADLCSLVNTREGEKEKGKEDERLSTIASSSADGLPLAIPHELYITGLDAALLQGYFNYNMTLHAYHFLRQSDGISCPAVWLHTGIDRSALLASGLLDPLDPSRISDRGVLAIAAAMESLRHRTIVQEPTGPSLSEHHEKHSLANDTSAENASREDAQPDPEASEKASALVDLRAALQGTVKTSFGVMVQPLGAGTALEMALWQLQQRLVGGVAALQVGEVQEEVEAYVRSPSLQGFLRSESFHDYACQNVLSILTGDVEKSYQVAEKARQCTQDPGKVAPTVQAIRRELKLHEIDLTIDMQVEDTKRTAVDFFCRCSPATLMEALKSLPEKSYQDISGQVFRCSKCSKEYHLSLPKREQQTARAE